MDVRPTTLMRAERPPAGRALGLLLLHHGRGADERDLLALADALDPERRLHVFAPRAPLQLEGSPGYHWYLVPRVGYPDPDTFAMAYAALGALHEELWALTGIPPASTVLGGFSMGAVMSYATALGLGRPQVAGILAFSGFVPGMSWWEPSFDEHALTRAFIAHGRADGVIDVRFARAARELLEEGGLAVDYQESDVTHQIDPAQLPLAAAWLWRTLAGSTPAPE